MAFMCYSRELLSTERDPTPCQIICAWTLLNPFSGNKISSEFLGSFNSKTIGSAMSATTQSQKTYKCWIFFQLSKSTPGYSTIRIWNVTLYIFNRKDAVPRLLIFATEEWAWIAKRLSDRHFTNVTAVNSKKPTLEHAFDTKSFDLNLN